MWSVQVSCGVAVQVTGPAVVLRNVIWPGDATFGAAAFVLHVEDCYRPDREREAELVYGTTSREHPGVAALLDHTNSFYVGGTIEGLQHVNHPVFCVQYHPEASPGPHDADYLFGQFLEEMEKRA